MTDPEEWILERAAILEFMFGFSREEALKEARRRAEDEHDNPYVNT